MGLQFEPEKEYIDEAEVEYEVFAAPEVVAKPVRQLNEDGEEVPPEEPPAEGDDGPKKPTFRVEDHRWTVTDRQPKNLPQLFLQSKGIGARHETKTAAGG